MITHKIPINDFISEDYELIAIHSSLDDYKLAYTINAALDIRLKKNDSNLEIEIEEGKSAFSNYVFDDEENDVVWTLIENKTTILTSKNKTSQLFDAVDITVFLLPEFRKADYLLKIENIDSYFNEEEIIGKILAIKNITTAYALDPTNLKSKNNLIF
ncbi:IPExxxVDY family protein [Flavobacterium ardleyense]|uniref:IPExxxVDY family protein n=1 Tax=Flavobacterium ardleyense TaxID=2038737 RepID=A0ABW5Z6T7_9FLAO